MNRMLVAGAAVAAAVIAAPAMAAPTIYFQAGVYNYSAVPYATTAAVFQSFSDPKDVVGQQYVARPGEVKAGNVTIQAASITNTTADPEPANVGNYLSIGANTTPGIGVYQVSFASPVQFFSFILGSLDTYNTLALTFSNGSVQTYTGGQIIGRATAGDIPGVNVNGNSPTSGRASYDAGGGLGIAFATFSSTAAAFEIDELSSAVPEPATWGMMILGVGLVGSQLRTRRRKVTFATA